MASVGDRKGEHFSVDKAKIGTGMLCFFPNNLYQTDVWLTSVRHYKGQWHNRGGAGRTAPIPTRENVKGKGHKNWPNIFLVHTLAKSIRETLIIDSKPRC